MIIVLVSSFNSSRILFLSFLSVGKNASNANLLVSSPLIVRAVIHAHAPGSEVTLIPASMHCLTISSPGSEMAGVPASVINAIFSPFKSFCTSVLAFDTLLYS